MLEKLVISNAVNIKVAKFGKQQSHGGYKSLNPCKKA